MDDFDLTNYKAGTLFADPPEGESHLLVACVGKNGGPYSFGQFAIGYMEANRRIKASLIDDPTMIDVLVNPIVFNYRQAVELGLKHLIIFLGQIYGSGDAPNMNHGLVDNWSTLRPLVERFRQELDLQCPTLCGDQLDGVERLIKDLHSFDPNSMVFRYPENKQGVAWIRGFSRIDVLDVIVNMSLLENWFQRQIEGMPDALTEAQ